MKIQIATAALAAATIVLALTACSKDETPSDGNTPDGGIKIVTTIAANTTGSTIDSRATFNPDGSGTFATGDKLAIWMEGSWVFTALHTIGTPFLTWGDIEKVFADIPQTSLTFSGYYPNGGLRLDNIFDLAASPDTDLLVATPVTVGKGEEVNLAFRHVMHRLVVSLTSNVLTAEELAAATVGLSDRLNPQALVDFTNATAFAANSGYMYPNAPRKTGAVTEFILVPQDLVTGQYGYRQNNRITLIAGGRDFTYILPSPLPGNEGTSTPVRLHGGKTLTVNLAINSTTGRSSAKSLTRSTAAEELTLECTGVDVSEW